MAEPEFIRGKFLPPAPVKTVEGNKILSHIQKDGRSAVEEIAQAVIQKIQAEIRRNEPGKNFWQLTGTADVGLATITVKTRVQIDIKPAAGG